MKNCKIFGFSKKVIKIEIPTKAEIEKLSQKNIDVEEHFVEVFRKELHDLLHPCDGLAHSL